MLLLPWAVQPITRERPARVEDPHGGFRDDWSSPDVLPLEGAVAPGVTLEDLQNRDTTLVQYTAYLEGQPDVLAGDRILFDGNRYAVDGEPARWPTPSGTGAMVLKLLRWEG